MAAQEFKITVECVGCIGHRASMVLTLDPVDIYDNATRVNGEITTLGAEVRGLARELTGETLGIGEVVNAGSGIFQHPHDD